ncbi:hypothetical protein [Maridesulfovibrio sp.]|uniref:hypothetical protein n=1 Tax=Maridesulfovibrio sp. TaxID=2795000 RepID=UPI003BAA02B1
MKFDKHGNPVKGTADESNEMQEVLEEIENECASDEVGTLFDKADDEDPETDPDFAQGHCQPRFRIKVQGVEKEISQDDLIRLAQMGDDYHIKMRHLNDERMRLESMRPLMQAWENDPAFRQHVMQYQKGCAPHESSAPHEAPLPEDPIEAFKEETIRETIERIAVYQQQQMKKVLEHAYARRIESAQQAIAADELRESVMAEMKKIAPEGSVLRERFNNDPQLFFSSYVQTRNSLMGAGQGKKSLSKKETSVAPILERCGSDVPGGQPSRKERARVLKEKAAGDFKAAGQLFDLAAE